MAPELSVGIYECLQRGDAEGARAYQRRLAPLRRAFALGTHPAMLKAGAEMTGAAGGPPRRPVAPLDEKQRETLREVLKGIGVPEADPP